MHFVLGSSSKRRKFLLDQIGIKPDLILKPLVNEQISKLELPLNYLKRITHEKMSFVKSISPNSIILVADTIVSVGRKVLDKTENINEAERQIKILSGRRHNVFTCVIISTPSDIRFKIVKSVIKFKRLTDKEILFYLNSKEWKNKAGSYAIQGVASRYISYISGSYTNVVGLPLHEVYNMLCSLNYIRYVKKNT